MQAFSLVVESGGYSLIAVHGLLIAVAFLVAEHRLWSKGSILVASGLRSSLACGIFLDWRLNLCPPHWQADSYPLRGEVWELSDTSS